ncbi:MAG: hypothetical protein WKF36_10365 [Candidatus Nitrosocosmicus sp.]
MTAEDIFLDRMAILAYVEKRPFSFKDFLLFDHEGKTYHYTHGTIGNTFSKLGKEDKIEPVYQSSQAFYTLKGVDVGKSITLNHGEDYLNHKQNRFLKFLDELPMDKESIHNIRLRFQTKGIWSVLSSSASASATSAAPPPAAASRLVKNIDMASNRDIILHDIDLKDHIIKTTVHKTDTVSVMVACSDNPIPIDILGLARLTSGLTRVEERLQRVMIDAYSLKATSNNSAHIHNIPNHMSWIVTMWHFGRDSLTGYTGEMFEIPWKEGLELFRMYSKKSKDKKSKKVRKEKQEYPNKPLVEAFMDKMNEINGDDVAGGESLS